MRMLERWSANLNSFNKPLSVLLDEQRELVPYEITNIAAGMTPGKTQPLAEYPSITTPYPYMWIEYDLAHYDFAVTKYKRRVGIRLLTLDLDPNQSQHTLRAKVLGHFANDFLGINKMDDGWAENHDLLDHKKPRLRWLQLHQVFMDKDQKELAMLGYVLTYVSDNGTVFLPQGMTVIPNHIHPDQYTRQRDLISTADAPAMMALSLLNCKNITSPDEQVPAQIIARKQKDRKTYFVYKTITINPIGSKKSATANTTAQQSRPQPFHMVRGHFKDYREGPGLFGQEQLRGLYWWQPFATGDLNQGAIIKGYKAGKKTES